ncbi:DUF6475 domain-containing protein [Vibrio penaeicida]|uniref:DUF6475 domain-containing protein n=1 Tax=Vibrio penaeicida TaxID=104609 RepID=UPI000CE9D0A4|nr:DUF6475 domain-containing protein [Vibrio penaeicida]
MNLSEKTLFAQLLYLTASLYMRKDLSREMLGVYWKALEHYDLEEVRTALNQHVRNPDTGQFFPKPADVIRLLEGTTDTRGERAWSKVHDAIGSVGVYSSVVFDDAVIHAVINEMGGWVTLCHTDSDELPYRHNEFVKRYQSYATQSPATYPRVLVGLSEAGNLQSGQPVDPPMVVGDGEKVRQVYRCGSADNPNKPRMLDTAQLLALDCEGLGRED